MLKRIVARYLAIGAALAALFAAGVANAQLGQIPPSNTALTVAVTATGAGTTAATTATLPAIPGRMTFICGFSISASATGATSGNATVATVINGNTLTFGQNVGTTPVELLQNFSPCIPANAVNTAITVTSAAAGTGGVTNVAVWGFTYPSP